MELTGLENRPLFYALSRNTELMIVLVNRKGGILWSNDRFFEYISGDPENILDQDIFKLVPDLLSHHMDEKFRQCLETQENLRQEIPLAFHKRKLMVQLSAVPCELEKGGERILLLLLEDMTRTYDLVKNLRSNEMFIENLLENVRNYSIIITDKEFNISKFNKGSEVLLEYDRSEVEKRMNVTDMFPESSRSRFDEIITTLNVLTTVRREVELRNKQGNIFIADLTVIKMFKEKGELAGYIFIATDMTEQKKMKEDIEKANRELTRLYHETQKASRAKSIFLANMSHEVRTPLTAILGFSEMLLDESMGALNNVQKDFLNDIWTSGKHLLNLINDILDLSKIEAEKLELCMEKVCLQEVIDTAKTFVLPLAREKRLKLIDHIPEEKIYVHADESRIKQILYNLYSNAFKFNPEDGSISTEVWKETDVVSISIRDTGIGISPEDQLVIFEEFIQIENPFSKKYKGTGLGLALVKKFIQMMGGSITVQSEGEGKGSTFIVKIPCYKE